MAIPIRVSDGLKLEPTSRQGISRAVVENPADSVNLPWDRFVRLKRAAEATTSFRASTILDAGGYDGAIAFFLPDKTIDVIDPATTGGSILQIAAENESYDAVIAIDVLEHIEPVQRKHVISELSRVASKYLVLNYPSSESKEAQELALRLTNNQLIREHVEWELPDSNWVLEELSKHGFSGTITMHTSIAVWLGQFVTLNLLPEQARELNRHLVAHYADEPTSQPLYHLVVSERRELE